MNESLRRTIHLFIFLGGLFLNITYLLADGLPPIVVNDTVFTLEDQSMDISILDNDSDPDGAIDSTSIVIIDEANNGTTIVDLVTGVVTYIPGSDFVGIDFFEYTVCDTEIPVLCDTAIVMITITSIPDTVYTTVPENSSVVVCTDTTTNIDGTITGVIVCEGSNHGTTTVAAEPCVEYTPDPGYFGPDTICVITATNLLFSDTTIIVVNVTIINDPPVAEDTTVTTLEDEPIMVCPVFTDVDGTGDSISVLSCGSDNGTGTITANDSCITYTTEADFVGTDSICYVICNAEGLCDTAVITINVNPVKDTAYIIPVQEDSVVTVCPDTLTNIEGAITSVTVCDGGDNGTTTVVTESCVEYTPDPGYFGPDTICVITATNLLLSDTSIIIVNVTDYNSRPIAIDDTVFTKHGIPIDIPVLNNDYDPDGIIDSTTLTIVNGANNGSTQVISNSITYTPNLNFIGIDSFEYAICDTGMPVFCDVAMVRINVTSDYRISGTVKIDSNYNCQVDVMEEIYSGLILSLVDDDNQFYGVSFADGSYSIYVDTPGNYALQSHLANDAWMSCIDNQIVNVGTVDTTLLDIPLQKIYDCSLLNVSVGNNFLRRCSYNPYTLHYSNSGTIDAEGVFIDFIKDPFMEIESPSQAYTQIGDTIRFNIDTVQANTSGIIYFSIYLNCNVDLGQNHCVEARIYPASYCEVIHPAWDNSSVAVSGSCENDTVVFRITNIGSAPMSKIQSYSVAEENVVFREGQFQLGIDEELILKEPAQGVTYYLMAEQSENHPGNSHPTAIVDGCNGLFTPSTANQLPLDDENYFVDIDCKPNIGSFDPNDKFADLIGYEENHYIWQNISLEYTIRFQNTGTDTAFMVVITDTLSPYVNPSTILPDPSSHNYTWDLTGQGVVTFTFTDIQLPDSNVDLEGSNGFVSFKISQQVDNPIGSVIENNAAIYFDFNEAVITNTVWHTVGEDFVERDIRVNVVYNELFEHVNIYPNPASSRIIIEISNHNSNEIYSIKIFNPIGEEVVNRKQMATDNHIQLNVSALAVGVYLLQLEGKDGKSLQAKIVVVE